MFVDIDVLKERWWYTFGTNKSSFVTHSVVQQIQKHIVGECLPQSVDVELSLRQREL